MKMNKLVLWVGIGFIFFLISCKPVRIVSAKYNGSDVIPFPYGNMRIIAHTRNNTVYSLWFNYFFTDTIIFRPNIITTHRGSVISHYSHELFPKVSDFREQVLYGDSVLRIWHVFGLYRTIDRVIEASIPDTFFVHISGFYDKRNNPIPLDPIEYYIEDIVNYNPFRDGSRDHVSSKRKIEIDFRRGYLLVFDNGQYRRYVYGKPR